MLISELKELIANVPDYYTVNLTMVNIGNGDVQLLGNDGLPIDISRSDTCSNCGEDIPVHYRLEPRPKLMPVTQAQELEALELINQMKQYGTEIRDQLNVLTRIAHNMNQAWKPE